MAAVRVYTPGFSMVQAPLLVRAVTGPSASSVATRRGHSARSRRAFSGDSAGWKGSPCAAITSASLRPSVRAASRRCAGVAGCASRRAARMAAGGRLIGRPDSLLRTCPSLQGARCGRLEVRRSGRGARSCCRSSGAQRVLKRLGHVLARGWLVRRGGRAPVGMVCSVMRMSRINSAGHAGWPRRPRATATARHRARAASRLRLGQFARSRTFAAPGPAGWSRCLCRNRCRPLGSDRRGRGSGVQGRRGFGGTTAASAQR